MYLSHPPKGSYLEPVHVGAQSINLRCFKLNYHGGAMDHRNFKWAIHDKNEFERATFEISTVAGEDRKQ
jgi:hypothetical protein